jgi:hypothetical protein
MNRHSSRLKGFAIGAILFGIACILAISTQLSVPAQPKQFRMFHALISSAAPEFEEYGLERIYGLGQAEDYWEGTLNPTSFPDEKKTRATARTRDAKHTYYIDIEHLNFDDKTIQANTKKLTQIAQWVRSERPDLKFGYYALLPITTFWFRNETWRKYNDTLKPVAQYVDYVFPDLYTFYDDPKGWIEQAKDSIAEARKYKKPVYIFLMPTFHSGGDAGLSGKFISGDYWRKQLEIAYQYADGAVLWGWYPDQRWETIASETDPKNWWYQTVDFMKQKKLLKPQR